MEESFWRKRWRDNMIGFHRDTVNPALARYCEHFPKGGRVLMPLAGKSVDMTFVAERGHPVVGVELVESAVVDYYAERGVEPERRGDGVYVGGGVEMWARNIFDVGPDELGTFECIYDRAALVALAPDQRPKYAEHLKGLLAPGGRLLLVTFDYDQSEMNGPPHAVPRREVEGYFADLGKLELLHGEDLIEQEPRFKAKGLSSFTQLVFLVERQR